MTPQPLFDDTEAARRVGLSPKTLRNKRVTGDGPRFVKLGRAVRYREEDLAAWVAEHVVSSTSEKAVA